MSDASLQQLQNRANRLRALSIKATTAAGSGHPTSCLSAADLVAGTFFHAMRYDPKQPRKVTNDRFVLSKGHAAPVLYAAMEELGTISTDDVMSLRKIDSDIEGHPTPRLPFVDVATGSLGQGLSAGAGMALANQKDGLDARVYVLLGDGEMAEGSVWEAAAFASFYKLDNLTAMIDVNGLGQTKATMYKHDTGVYARRLAAFGWNAIEIDGHDMGQVVAALDNAKATKGQPTVIVARTDKGHGVSFLSGADDWHGKAVGKAQLDAALAELKVPDSLPRFEPKLPPDPPAKSAAPIPPITPDTYSGPAATREGYGKVIAKLARADRRVIAVDGDTSNSTFAQTVLKYTPDQFVEAYIAEQNMVGVAVGLQACGKIPFTSTFGAFYARAYDQIRMAAISLANVKLVGSHAGISIGQDGPSQMALEDLAMMRAVQGSTVLCPSDAVCCERLVEAAAHAKGIVYVRTSRPKVAILYGPDEKFPIGGSKVLRESAQDQVLIVGTGVTVYEALAAHDTLKNRAAGKILVRVVDAYSIKPIDVEGLKRAAAAAGNRVITVEDHYPEGGLGDAVLAALTGTGASVTKLAVNGLPRSGEPEELFEKFGISAAHVVRAVEHLL